MSMMYRSIRHFRMAIIMKWFRLSEVIFGQALKTNEFLQFAVLTGCLRISKESIFTGLNNFKVMSITDVAF